MPVVLFSLLEIDLGTLLSISRLQTRMNGAAIAFRTVEIS